MNNTNLACFFSKFIDNQLFSVIKLKTGYFCLNHHASPLNKNCSSSLKETLGASTKNIIFLTSVTFFRFPRSHQVKNLLMFWRLAWHQLHLKIPAFCMCSIVCCMSSLPALVVACKQKSQNCKNSISPPIIGFTCCSFLLRTFLGRNGQSSKNHD